jgi:hypothetical protein
MERLWWENLTVFDFRILKQIVQICIESQETNLNLFTLLRALYSIQQKENVSKKQAVLIQTVLLILDRLLPNQSWPSKVEFLELNLSNQFTSDDRILGDLNSVMNSRILNNSKIININSPQFNSQSHIVSNIQNTANNSNILRDLSKVDKEATSMNGQENIPQTQMICNIHNQKYIPVASFIKEFDTISHISTESIISNTNSFLSQKTTSWKEYFFLLK